jgi:hypothetical protein
MSDCLKSWVADEVNGEPHLVEDPRAIVSRLRQLRDKRAGAILRHEANECNERLLIRNPLRSRKKTDVETAIEQLEQMIANNGGSLNVTRSSTMDLLQSHY